MKSRRANFHHPAFDRDTLQQVFFSGFSHTAPVLAILCSLLLVLSMIISVHSPSWCKHCMFFEEYSSHCSILPCSQISRSTPLSTIVTVQVCISPLICTSDQFFCDSKAWIATVPIYWTSHKITTSIDVCRDYLSIQ